MTDHSPSQEMQRGDRFDLPVDERAAGGEGAASLVAPHLVAPHLVAIARRIAHGRRVRDRVFGPSLCINPPWHILVELFVAAEEGRNVTIKSACVAAGVPQSTALRHIAHLIDKGLCVRSQHPSDARSAHLKLSRAAHARMIEFLRQIAESADARGG